MHVQHPDLSPTLYIESSKYLARVRTAAASGHPSTWKRLAAGIISQIQPLGAATSDIYPIKGSIRATVTETCREMHEESWQSLPHANHQTFPGCLFSEVHDIWRAYCSVKLPIYAEQTQMIVVFKHDMCADSPEIDISHGDSIQ